MEPCGTPSVIISPSENSLFKETFCFLLPKYDAKPRQCFMFFLDEMKLFHALTPHPWSDSESTSYDCPDSKTY